MQKRRILAFIMALVLTGSTFANASLTAYATPAAGDEMIIAEEDTQEASLEVAEEETTTEVVVETVAGTVEETVTEDALEEVESVTEVSSEEAETMTEEMTTEEALTEEAASDLNQYESAVVQGLDIDYGKIGEIVEQNGDKDLWIREYDITEAGLEVSDEVFVNIINAYKDAGAEVDNVSIWRYDACTTISMAVWNAAIDLMEATQGNGECEFIYGVHDKDSLCSMHWTFYDISKVSQDVDITLEFTAAGAGEGWYIQFANTVFAAKSVDINYSHNAEQEGYQEFKDALAKMTKEPMESAGVVYDRDGNEIYGTAVIPTSGETYYNASVFGIEKLEAGVEYRVRMPLAYTGTVQTWEDGTKELLLLPWEAEMECFSKQNLLDIFAEHNENTYGNIYIDHTNGGGTVNGAVINAAAGLLDKNWEGTTLKFGFNDSEAGKCMDLCIVDPSGKEADEDMAVSAMLQMPSGSVSGNNPVLIKNVPEFASGRVDLWFGVSSESEDGKALIERFGKNERRLEIADTDTWVNYNVDEYNVCFYIGDTQNLENNTSYDIAEYVYKGDVVTWDDGRKELNIRYEDAFRGNEPFSKDELLSILDNYDAEDDLYCIYIQQPSSDGDIIYKEVADKAAELLDGGLLKFAFKDVTTGSTMEWQLEGISAGVKQNADQTVKASFAMSEDDRFVFNRENMDLKVDEDGVVSIGYFINTENEPQLTKGILSVLGDGEGYRLIEVVGSETGGEMSYNKEYNELWFYINGIDSLEANRDYAIANWTYRGNVNSYTDHETGEEVYSLWISSVHGLGQDSLDLASLNSIVDYWTKERGMTFSEVSIEQKYTDNNVIKKGLINAAISLLSNPSEQNIRFVFCDCKDAEYSEEGELVSEFVQNDMNWTLFGVRAATKDINANVNITGKGGAGVSVVLKSNTYPADWVNVDFWMHETSEMVQKHLVPALGRPKSESTVIVLEKASSLSKNAIAYYNNSEEEGYASLNLMNVQDWKPEIDNRLIEVYYRPQLLLVGDSINLPYFSYDPQDPEDPGYPPEDPEAEWYHPDMPKSNPKFKVLTPEYATITDEFYLTALTPYQTVYTLCTYTSVSDKTCLEVLAFDTTVGVKDLEFKDTELTIEWDGQEREEGEIDGFLEILLKPSIIQNMVNPQGFEWYVDGNSVILPEFEWEYNFVDPETGEEISGTDMRKSGVFYINDYGTTTVTVKCGEAESVCTIHVIKPVEVPEVYTIYAIPDVDATLADLGDLDALVRAGYADPDNAYEGSFAWKNPSAALAPYKNNFWAEFGAVYTAKDGRKVDINVQVDMLKIEEIALRQAEAFDTGDVDEEGRPVKNIAEWPLDGTTVQVGDALVMGYQVNINRGQFIYNESTGEYELTDAFKTFARYIDEGKMEFRWKEALPELPAGYEDRDVYFNGRVQKPRLFTASEKGKKTFTVQAVNLLTDEVFFESSATVNVSQRPVFTFDEEADTYFEFKDVMDAADNRKGTFVLTIGAENYENSNGLKYASGDKTVLKIGSAQVTGPVDGVYTIKIPYEFKKFGRTVLKVTASDELKTSKSFVVERVDYAPKVSRDAYTVDKAWYYYDGPNDEKIFRSTEVINFAFHHDTTPAGMAEIADAESKAIFRLSGNVDAAQYYIELIDPDNVKDKKYTVTLTIPYKVNGEILRSEQTIDVTVKESKIKVTAKQTKKINEFYKHFAEESRGIITLGTPSELGFVKLNDDSVFELMEVDGNGYDYFEYALVAKNPDRITSLSDAQKEVELEYYLMGSEEGVYHSDSIRLTLKTEKKAPSLVIDKKNDTLYPNMGISSAFVSITDKSTGYVVEIADAVSLVVSGSVQPVTTSDGSVDSTHKVGKNTYGMYTDDYNIYYWLQDDATAVKGTDKFVFRVQKDDWNEAVDIKYSAIINLKAPSLKLGKNSITINANEDVYRYQSALTTINVKGYNNSWFDNIWYVGMNDASVKALNNNFEFRWDGSAIRVLVQNKGNEQDGTLLAPGNYKYKVYASVNGYEMSTNLTVKVVDKSVAQSVKVTKKGSIDILRRYTTNMTMNPKISNLYGELSNFELTGPDSTLFETDYDWVTGNCVVQARYGAVYSTKTTYNVTPVYTIWTEDGIYKVEGKAQTIKLTQGKPKISVWSNTSTLYGDKSIGALLAFDAKLKDEYVAIRNVELLNYTKDLDWNWEPLYDYNNDCFADAYDENNDSIEPLWDMGRLTIKQGEPKELFKASQKCTLKFAITYEDAAGNEKVQTVSYKLNIVR